MVDKWIGKVAVVTGASSGIGAAIFKDFANSGIIVIGLARRLDKVEEIIKELGVTKGKAYAFKCDISDPKSVTETFKLIESQFGVVNILVNNAGIVRMTGILEESDESFKKAKEIFDTNVIGLVQATRDAYKLMKKSDDYGLIININSVAGHAVPFLGIPLGVYPASKYAVTALTETIRQELIIYDNKKIRITVSLGFIFGRNFFVLTYTHFNRAFRLVMLTQKYCKHLVAPSPRARKNSSHRCLP